MNRPGQILTMLDLKDISKLTKKSRDSYYFWATALLVAMLVATFIAAVVNEERLKQHLKTATEKVATEKARADAAELRYKNLDGAMKMSIDARKLGRPLRVSGEMIITFAGEVKE